ncbi:hypothetical protein HK102_004495 [Quaeritorhiza haematococci]|nr:hypothetical protein HK102_004495 [Quaeritorhiza haematococci]
MLLLQLLPLVFLILGSPFVAAQSADVLFTKASKYTHLALAVYTKSEQVTIPGSNTSYTRTSHQISPIFDLEAAVYVDDKFTENKAGEIIVSFEGTDTPQEWGINLNINMSDCVIPGGANVGKAHSGFQTAWADVRAGVEAEVNRLLATATGPVNVALTGHSLGGAIARLAAIEFNTKKMPLNDVYVFGTPRLGNAAFEAAFEAAKQPGQSFVEVAQVNPDTGLFRFLPKEIDPVTLIPIPLETLDYADSQTPSFQVPCLNVEGQRCGFLELHNMRNYVRNVPQARAAFDTPVAKRPGAAGSLGGLVRDLIKGGFRARVKRRL